MIGLLPRRLGPIRVGVALDHSSSDTTTSALISRCAALLSTTSTASSHETVYTGSGMAAISALLFASAHVMGQADILVLPGSYGETLELIEGYTRPLRLVTLKHRWKRAIAQTCSPRIMLLDSCTPASAFEATLRCTRPALDLLIYDTTCFSSGSGRIRRVLRWARKCSIPVVMVRSHTKLDSLGAEYGRLGSTVFVHWGKNDPWTSRSKCKETSSRNAKRSSAPWRRGTTGAFPAIHRHFFLPSVDEEKGGGHLAQRSSRRSIFRVRASRPDRGAPFCSRPLCQARQHAAA